MILTEEQVEWIVGEVVRRLRLLEVSAAGDRNPSTAELRLMEKVVTLRTLQHRLTGVTRVVVEPRAVVTPAVKDELRARKIELTVRRG